MPTRTESDDLARDYALVFTTDPGKRVLAHMQATAFYGKTILVQPTETSPVDPMMTMYNEGRRTKVLEVMAWIARGQAPRLTEPQTHAVSSRREA